jgi:hypothetical protein
MARRSRNPPALKQSHHSDTNALDGGVRRFMLPRFSLAESRLGKDPANTDPAQTDQRASLGLESAGNK